MFVRSLVSSLALLAAVPAQHMLCIESTRDVYELDTATGTRTLLGRLSANVGTAAGCAFDLDGGNLYVTSTSTDSLYRVDLSDWHAVSIGPLGGGAALMTGIEWDLARSTLYGVDVVGGLYTIDTQTGAASPLAALPFGAASLGYDPFRDAMFVADITTDCLYELDAATGAPALVGPLVNSVNPSGLAFDIGAGTMYLCDNVTDDLYSVDLDTGVATVVASLGPSNVIGMAYLPGDGFFLREENGCGAVTLFATGDANIGGGVEFTVENPVGVPLVGFGTTAASAPICGCVLGHDWVVAELGPSVRFPIPTLPAAVGLQVRAQGADLFGAASCSALPVTLTDTVIVEIGS